MIDGPPGIRFCINCCHYGALYGWMYACAHPNNLSRPSLVDGSRKPLVQDAEELRDKLRGPDYYLYRGIAEKVEVCGPAGKWYEPRTPSP